MWIYAMNIVEDSGHDDDDDDGDSVTRKVFQKLYTIIGTNHLSCNNLTKRNVYKI